VLVIAFNSKPKIRLSPQRGKGDNPFIWWTTPLYCLGNVIANFPIVLVAFSLEKSPWVSSTFDWQLAVQPVVSTNI
jgi:hypothetical protein